MSNINFLKHTSHNLTQRGIRSTYLIIDTVLISHVVVTSSIFALTILFCCNEPRRVIFVGRLIPKQYFIKTVEIFGILFQLHFGCRAASMCIVGIRSLIYTFYVTIIVSLELNLNRKAHISNDSFRDVNNLCHMYRTLQICNEYVINSFFGVFIFCMLGAFTFLSMFTNCTLIRYWSKLDRLAKAPLVIISPFCISRSNRS